MDKLSQIVLGYVVADLSTASFHWFEDTYFDYNSKIPIVSSLAKDNELHHYFPRAIVGYSYYENIRETLIIITILYLLIYFFNNKTFLNYPYFYITFFIFSVMSNIIHKWAHMRECELPKIILLLQNIGFLGNHPLHRLHHAGDSSQSYCVISSYLNPILDKIKFWRILEYIIYIFTGLKPKRKGAFDEYKEIHTYLHENVKLKCPEVPTKSEIKMLINILDKYMENKS
jgi:hypothetical protein